MQRALCPLFGVYKGEGGEGGYPHGSKGGGMGGVYRGGDKKTPRNYRGCVSMFDISK